MHEDKAGRGWKKCAGGDSGKGAQQTIRVGVIALPTTTSSTQARAKGRLAAGRHLAVVCCFVGLDCSGFDGLVGIDWLPPCCWTWRF
jgi:hypothetical protein